MTDAPDRMADEVVLVTGGTRGIGRAITEAFAARGATVVACYYSNEEAAAETETAFADAPGEVSTRQVDVRDYGAVDEAFDAVEDDHGQGTVLVNNAGVMSMGLVVRMDPEEWTRTIETNLTGTFNCTRRAVRSMLRGEAGSVVNISSIAGSSSWPGQTAYAASKAGIEGFTRSTARELGGRDVRINAVAPGLVQTATYEDLQEGGFDEASQGSIPQGREADPEEVAECVVFLASERASYVNGEVFRIDGGQLA